MSQNAVAFQAEIQSCVIHPFPVMCFYLFIFFRQWSSWGDVQQEKTHQADI